MKKAVALTVCFSVLFALATNAGEVNISQTVDLFEGIDQGVLDVKIVLANSKNGRVTIKNKSDVPFVVKLPETFAAVPLAQVGSGSNSQSVGGGFGGGAGPGMQGGMGMLGGNQWGGNQGLGQGGGQWNIPPERSIRQNIKTVCLEHGKRDPHRGMKYEIKPLTEVTDKSEVLALCALVGKGIVDQHVAQAAVWHYNNGLSWEELSNKRHKPRVDAMYTVPYFSHEQLAEAVSLGKKLEESAAKKEQSSSEQSYGVSE